MDNTANNAERSEEEVAWDKEFQDEKEMGLAAGIADMAKLAVKVPVAILQMPMSIIPEETAHHTRAALRETFLAFRSLLGAIGDGIENMLSDPEETPAPDSGPEGTWGRGRSTQPKSTRSAKGGRARRIELSDDDDATKPVPIPDLSDVASISSTDDEEETGEGRGLKANIDY